ncbi:M20/M25/M40 family metallo-hydrolase [Brevundimonas goettingensis]|uniref:M20/M25/M40 family metallo-hydrolase n=1 Tax=Brevundimonas goettingensis TaxID=2774190 RepID=A0A975C0B5_9CAUL|nr:M20/M25/M40 family metallo-hydrolase [Brevundimonas goettingensis]QTC91378.1 M20/M25/M40 family metallo-hydrolase [Brevundimonas goettingensis]
MTNAGASVAVAASMRAEKRIVRTLRNANATSPSTAVALAEGRLIQRGALRRLIKRNAVVEAGPDLYWLDDAAYAEMKKLRTSRIILTLFGLTALIIVVSAVTIARADAPQAAELRPDQVAFRGLYKELVETNTTLSEGDCTLAAQRMQARMVAAGYSEADARVVIPEDQPKFGSLIATLPGTDASAPAILLLAHIDVVEAKRSDWERDPFVLVEQDGYFYARGASDDKAQASVWVDSLIRLKQQGFQPRRTLKMALTCGEETNDNWNGVQWLLEHHPEMLQAGFALNEGAGGQLDANANRIALNVQAGEKVYQDYTLELTNPGGHSARPRKDNAIGAMGAALDRLVRHDFPLELSPVTRAYFSAIAETTPASAADLRALTAHDTPDAAAAARLGAANPVWNAMMRTTCIPTLISGGHAPNAQPQKVTVNVNCRILPGHSIAETQAEIASALANPAITIKTIGEPSPTSAAPPLTPAILDPIKAAAAKQWPGVPVVPTLSTGATDGRFTNAAGIPTYGVTGMFTDPDGNGVHGLNERLRVRSLYEGRDFLFALIQLYAMRE